MTARKRKILIVDDDLAFLELLSYYFSSAGYTVHQAQNVKEAVQQYRKSPSDVVLLDFQMPGATGERFMPELLSINQHARVIVVSGCLAKEVEEKFKGLGYYAYFEKGGLSLEKLRRKVDEALLLAE